VVAGFSASMKLNTFAITLFTTMSNAVSSFSAQNIGAGKPDRVKEGWKCGVKVGMMIVLPFTVVYLFFGKIAMQLFVQAESTAVIEAGVTFLRIVAPFYVLIIMKLISDGVLHGAAAVTLFMCDTFTDLILRVALAFILSDVLKSPVGIWLSWPIGWTISTIMALYFYFSGKWMKQIKENPLY
jgi:Na+-driven multidrug efflux pump